MIEYGCFKTKSNIGNIIIDICKIDIWDNITIYDDEYNIISNINTKYDEDYIDIFDDKIIIYSTIKGDIIIDKQHMYRIKEY